jgi:hypothetical protein
MDNRAHLTPEFIRQLVSTGVPKADGLRVVVDKIAWGTVSLSFEIVDENQNALVRLAPGVHLHEGSTLTLSEFHKMLEFKLTPL